jgi:nucleoside-diphosphate-sugar epimerase
MTTLLCFGLGYTAERYIGEQSRFDRIVATVRKPSGAIDRNHDPRLTIVAFDGRSRSERLGAAIAEAGNVLVSVPPDASGDVVLGACRAALCEASHLRSVVYLSTIGVYGNHDGAWVDEQSACRAADQAGLQRLGAEREWASFGAQCRVPVAILRLAGIYGPGRNALERMIAGAARHVLKPGHVFNRVHVSDIARAIDAAFERRADGVFNVADDEPAPPGDPIAFAARLLGLEAPAAIAFDEAKAAMSPRALRFYTDTKRATNTKLKTELGVELQFPTYREGLAALRQALLTHGP